MAYQFKRIAVKIGSNVLTRMDGSLDVTRMSALVDQVAELHRKGVEVVFNLFGSGSFREKRGEARQETRCRFSPPALLRSRPGQTDQPLLRTVPRT